MRKNDTSKKSNSDTYDIIIGKSSKVDGDILSEGSVRIEGTVNGSIDVKGNAIVGPESHVVGNIICRHIEISGDVKGNINCLGNLQVFTSGSLIGDIEVTSFNIEEGGVFDGNCKITKKVKPEAVTAKK